MLGMTSTFLLALLTDRAFLATWDHPVPLSLIFDSPAVDWSGPSSRLIPSFSPKEGSRPAHPLYDNSTLLHARANGSLSMHNGREGTVDELLDRLRSNNETGLLDMPWVRFERPNRGMAIHSFSAPTMLDELSALGLSTSTVYAQIVHYLFRPKLEALMFISEYASLFSLPTVFSVGIQVRTGDMFMGNLELDKVNTIERHQHFFDCANEVAETYAAPGQRPLWFLITDSATLRRSAAETYPDRVVVSGLTQHHNELRASKTVKPESVTHANGKPTVEELEREIDGMQNSVAESWIFSGVDFALLSYASGFGKIPTFMHAKPNRAIVVPRVQYERSKPHDLAAWSRPDMPSCRLETSLSSFSDLASNW
ncbi:hypothetical protein JCM8097_000192 [Rhodosporidiobolus ruineniae]